MEETLFSNRTDAAVEDKYHCNDSVNMSSQTTVTTSYLLCIFIGLLSALITCGNLLVIISIIYFKQLHTPTNYLILSLAVADLLVGVLLMPLSTVLSVSSCSYFNNLLCKIRGIVDITLGTCSILNLCFISVDRYYIVCQPLLYRTKMTVCVTAVMILISWTLSALLGLVITIRGLNQQLSQMRCHLFQKVSLLGSLGAVFSFYIPAIILLSIYLKILTVALKQARSIQNTTKSRATVNKMETKATKSLAIVMGVFLMCWTPFFFCVTLNPLSNYSIPVPVFEMFKWLGWSNSMLNPFVYGFFYSWFRSAFRIIISGKIFQGDFANSKLF